MTINQLIDAIGDIDDRYLEENIAGIPKRSRAPWGLIAAAACFCLLIGSLFFLQNTGLLTELFYPGVYARPSHGAPAQGWEFTIHSQGGLTEDGYYYLDRDAYRLTFFDFDTGQSRVLCSVADCTHEQDSCEAIVGSFPSRLWTAGGQIYYLDHFGDLRCRSADGTVDRLMGTLCAQQIWNGDNVSVTGYIHTQGYLYYEAGISNKSGDSLRRIGRLDLTTGADEVILELETPVELQFRNITVCAARDDGLLFLQSDGIVADREDPDKLEKSRSMPVYLRFWDARTGEVKTLLEKTRNELQNVALVEGSRIYYNGMSIQQESRGGVSCFDLRTGKDSVLYPEETLMPLGGGYAVLLKGNTKRIVHLESKESLSYAIDFLSYALSVSPKGFATMNMIPQADGSSAVQSIQFYYVPYAAMADGLQNEDLQYLFIQTVNSP